MPVSPITRRARDKRLWEEDKARRRANGETIIERGWPYGPKDRKMRAKFIALLNKTGQPSKAWELLDTLELWPDDDRPPGVGGAKPYARWLLQADQGAEPDKVSQRIVDQRYEAYYGEALRVAATVAAETQVQQLKKVQQGDFDPKLSGVFQHTTQLAVFGYEKVMQAKRPKKEDKFTFAPSFTLNAPPAQPVGTVTQVREITDGR